MAEIIKLRGSPHDEAQELLPWLVNGTLDKAEIERVETHLKDCPECQADLASERQLAAAIESSPIVFETAWHRMDRRLAAERLEVRPLKSLWLRKVPLGWAVASPVAAAAAIALIFVMAPSKQPTDPQYRALAAPTLAQPANLVVQFHSSARVSDMQEALEAVDGRVVGGPTETGAYLLHVDFGKRELVLKKLRDDQAIALAQPIDGPPRE